MKDPIFIKIASSKKDLTDFGPASDIENNTNVTAQVSAIWRNHEPIRQWFQRKLTEKGGVEEDNNFFVSVNAGDFEELLADITNKRMNYDTLLTISQSEDLTRESDIKTTKALIKAASGRDYQYAIVSHQWFLHEEKIA